MANPNLRDPLFNLREVCKNLLKLEEHLTDPDKYCPDCIRKHALLAEGYTDEAFQLDYERRYTALIQSVRHANERIREAIVNDVPEVVSIVRQARKELQPLVF